MRSLFISLATACLAVSSAEEKSINYETVGTDKLGFAEAKRIPNGCHLVVRVGPSETMMLQFSKLAEFEQGRERVESVELTWTVMSESGVTAGTRDLKIKYLVDPPDASGSRAMLRINEGNRFKVGDLNFEWHYVGDGVALVCPAGSRIALADPRPDRVVEIPGVQKAPSSEGGKPSN